MGSEMLRPMAQASPPCDPEPMPNLMPVFLWVARLEGLSLLILMFVAMPLKYGVGWTHATEVPGWAHGLLFMLYVALLGAVALRERWSILRCVLGFFAAFVPFGTFWFERRIALVPQAS